MERCDYCGYDCVRGTPCLDPEETQGCGNMEESREERRRGLRLLAWGALCFLAFCLWSAFLAGAWAGEPVRKSYASPRKPPGTTTVRPDRLGWQERVIVRDKATGGTVAICRKDPLGWQAGSLTCRWTPDG